MVSVSAIAFERIKGAVNARIDQIGRAYGGTGIALGCTQLNEAGPFSRVLNDDESNRPVGRTTLKWSRYDVVL
jgi:hypothetical protein